jgi:tetratricopeptide (TPR) repeat protein
MLDVLNEEHTKQLSKKVVEAMEEDWDIKQGVDGSVQRKPKPIAANIDLWSYQARKELLRSNFTGSEYLYRRCISYNPCDGRAWLGIARLCWKRGQPDLAEKAYKDGLYYNPKNPYLLQSWSVQLIKQGKFKQAMSLLTTSVKKNPSHAASWVEMGRLYQREGDTSSARYCFSTAVIK